MFRKESNPLKLKVWRREGDLNPKFLGTLVLQGELPRSPLLPRAFKLPLEAPRSPVKGYEGPKSGEKQ